MDVFEFSSYVRGHHQYKDMVPSVRRRAKPHQRVRQRQRTAFSSCYEGLSSSKFDSGGEEGFNIYF